MKLTFIYAAMTAVQSTFTARKVDPESLFIERNDSGVVMVSYAQDLEMTKAAFDAKFPRFESGDFKPISLGAGIKGYISYALENSESGMVEFELAVIIDSNKAGLEYIVVSEQFLLAQSVVPIRAPLPAAVLADALRFYV